MTSAKLTSALKNTCGNSQIHWKSTVSISEIWKLNANQCSHNTQFWAESSKRTYSLNYYTPKVIIWEVPQYYFNIPRDLTEKNLYAGDKSQMMLLCDIVYCEITPSFNAVINFAGFIAWHRCLRREMSLDKLWKIIDVYNDAKNRIYNWIRRVKITNKKLFAQLFQ